MNRRILIGRALSLGALAVLAACETPATAPSHDHHAEVPAAASAVPALPQQGRLAQQVKAHTARFNSMTQAERAGYALGSECVAVPGLGGMGFHYVNVAEVDPQFDPMRPEAVLYAPDARGKLRLVAVEYIVIDVGQPAPLFAGQPFDVGGTPVPAPHWSLHVWVHEENPAGLFVPFNPNVNCG